ncbi:uncharacterized protein [Clytia hemisphaerica]|uniref:uncharacterized protein isoform X2 n=1 Tax=Clytia hemisphaerica TaxID=252671 RepID=UPI0034D42BAD
MNSSRIVARILGSDNSVLSERNRLFRRNNRDNGTPKAKKVKIVSKDVYLLDKETTTMPRGADKCSLHQRKQVITAFQLEGYLTEEELYDRLEQCFSEVLDFSSPVPRFEYVKYISGQLVTPTLGHNVTYDSTTVLSICRQGDIYLRATHDLNALLQHRGTSSTPSTMSLHGSTTTPQLDQPLSQRPGGSRSAISLWGSTTTPLSDQPSSQRPGCSRSTVSLQGSTTTPLSDQRPGCSRSTVSLQGSTTTPLSDQQPSQQPGCSRSQSQLRELFPNLTDWQVSENLHHIRICKRQQALLLRSVRKMRVKLIKHWKR